MAGPGRDLTPDPRAPRVSLLPTVPTRVRLCAPGEAFGVDGALSAA
jgi:hypothetical protein